MTTSRFSALAFCVNSDFTCSLLRQNHPHQFFISPVVDVGTSYFREIVESGRTFAGNVYADDFFIGIDDA